MQLVSDHNGGKRRWQKSFEGTTKEKANLARYHIARHAIKKRRKRVHEGPCYTSRDRCNFTENSRRSNQRGFAYRDGSERSAKELQNIYGCCDTTGKADDFQRV